MEKSTTPSDADPKADPWAWDPSEPVDRAALRVALRLIRSAPDEIADKMSADWIVPIAGPTEESARASAASRRAFPSPLDHFLAWVKEEVGLADSPSMRALYADAQRAESLREALVAARQAVADYEENPASGTPAWSRFVLAETSIARGRFTAADAGYRRGRRLAWLASASPFQVKRFIGWRRIDAQLKASLGGDQS